MASKSSSPLSSQDLSRMREKKRALSWCAAMVGVALVAIGVWWFQDLRQQRSRAKQRREQSEAKVRHLERSLATTPEAVRILLDRKQAPPAPETIGGTQRAELQFQVNGLKAGVNEWVALADGDALASGDAFYIRAVPLTDGYLYIFRQDSGGKLEWLFPQNSTSSNSAGTNPVRANSVLSLPAAQESAYTLDETVGAEHFFAVLCANRWPDLEAALYQTNRPIKILPLDHDVAQLLTARAKGIAGVIAVGPRTSETRLVKGRALSATIQPVAFRSTSHWLFVHRTVRHLPGTAQN
jgi:hypothetical protein